MGAHEAPRQALIVAAGAGTRLGAKSPKALVNVAGQPLLAHAVYRFARAGLAGPLVVVAPPGAEARFLPVVERAAEGHACTIVAGGAERQDSVARGLDALDPDTELVAIHDAARPFVSEEAIAASFASAAEYGAATVAIPCADTILEADEAALLQHTPDRSRLWACQTPQTFRVAVIRAAHEHAQREGFLGTDDASLVRRAGHPVKLVRGTAHNFKVTTPDDLALAEAVAAAGLA